MLRALVVAFNWAGGRAWRIADIFRGVADNGWIGAVGLSGGFNWLADVTADLAYALWDAAEGAYSAQVWIEDRARELWDLASYTYDQLAQNFWYLWNQVQDLASRSWDWLTTQVTNLISQVAQLWDRFWDWAEPYLRWVGDRLGELASYVTDTLWPWVQGQITNTWDWFTQELGRLTGRAEVIEQTQADQEAKRSPWDSLVGLTDRLRWLATDAWDGLTKLIANPGDTIWAWLEIGLLARIEAWLITVWDGTDRKAGR